MKPDCNDIHYDAGLQCITIIMISKPLQSWSRGESTWRARGRWRGGSGESFACFAISTTLSIYFRCVKVEILSRGKSDCANFAHPFSLLFLLVHIYASVKHRHRRNVTCHQFFDYHDFHHRMTFITG